MTTDDLEPVELQEQEEARKSGILLSVRDLATIFNTEIGVVHAVDGVSFDVRSGEVLAALGDGTTRGSFLNDGRIVLEARVPGGEELRLLSPDGRTQLWRLPFPGARTLTVAVQRAGTDPLRVVTSGPRPTDPATQLWQVDRAHGTARSLGRRALGRLEFPLLILRPPQRPEPLSGKDGLIWWDSSSQRQRVILKGP